MILYAVFVVVCLVMLVCVVRASRRTRDARIQADLLLFEGFIVLTLATVTAVAGIAHL